MSTWDVCKNLIINGNHKQLLKEIGLDPTLVFKVGNLDRSLLMTAASFNDFNCLKILIQAGSEINCKNKNGTTSLMYAAARADIKIVQYLLDHGADVSNQNIIGSTAFRIALDRNFSEIIDLLLSFFDTFNENDRQLYKEYRLKILFM